jgi:hypothetical protein
VDLGEGEQLVDHSEVQRRPIEGCDHRNRIDVGRHRFRAAARARPFEGEGAGFARIYHGSLTVEVARDDEIACYQREAILVFSQ